MTHSHVVASLIGMSAEIDNHPTDDDRELCERVESVRRGKSPVVPSARRRKHADGSPSLIPQRVRGHDLEFLVPLLLFRRQPEGAIGDSPSADDDSLIAVKRDPDCALADLPCVASSMPWGS